MNTMIEKLAEMLVVPVVVLDDEKDAEKLADALVNGKRLRIEGGDYTLCDGLDSDCCQNSSCCKRKRAEMEEQNND